MPEKEDLEIVQKKIEEDEKKFFSTDIDLDKTEEQEIIKIVGDEIEKAITDMGDLPQKKKAWIDLYEGNIKEKTFPWVNCYSKDTEVLTNSGWKFIKDVKLTDKVYSINPETNEATYQNVTNTISQFANKLVSFKTKSIDLLVTHNHQLLVVNPGTNKNKFKEAEYFLKKPSGFRIPLTSNWQGNHVETIHGFNAEDYMEFLGWYISEGWTFKYKDKNGGEKNNSIGISQLQNSDGYFEITKLLNKMGLRYSYGNHSFVISVKSLPLKMREEISNCGNDCYSKYIPEYYKNLSSDLLESLLETLTKGDGCKKNRIDRVPTWSYYTTSKKLADDIQEIAQKINLRATIKIREEGICTIRNKSYKTRMGYTVAICFKNRVKLNRCEIKEIEYGDYVYCVTTQYHTLYVRRNGIPVWCGNCANVAASSAVIAAVCEGYHNRIMSAIFASGNVWMCRPLPGTNPDKAELAQDYLQYIQSVKMNLESVLDDGILDLTKCANMFAILEWSYKTEKIRDIESYETVGDILKENSKPLPTDEDVEDGYKSLGKYGFPTIQLKEEYEPFFKKLFDGKGKQEVMVEYNRVEENKPKLSFIDWDDFFVSGGKDAHKDLSRARLVGHKLRLRWDDFKRRAKVDEEGKKTDNPFGIYINLDKLKESYSGGKDKKPTEEYLTREYDIRQSLFRYDIDNDGYEEKCIFSIDWDSKILVRAELYPYWHNRVNYLNFPFLPRAVNKLFCKSIPEMLENLAEEYDKLTNQQLDNNTLANTVQFKGIAGSSAEEEFGSQGFYPAVVWWLEGFNEIEQMQISHNALETLQTRQEIQKLIELRAGYSGYFQGQTPASDPKAPASKTAMLLREALMKVEDVIARLRREPLRELAYQIWELCYQYKDEDEEIGITNRGGGDTRRVTRKDMVRYGLEFVPMASSLKANKELDKELDLMLIQVMVKTPQIFGAVLNNPEAVKEIAETVIRNWGSDWAAKLDKLLPKQLSAPAIDAGMQPTPGPSQGPPTLPAPGPPKPPIPQGGMNARARPEGQGAGIPGPTVRPVA